MFVTCAATATVLTADAYSAREWSDYRATVIDPLLRFVGTVQEERTGSMSMLAGSPAAESDLQARRADMNAALDATVRISERAKDLDQAAISRFTVDFGQLLTELPTVRRAVDERRIASREVGDFYTRLVGAIADGGQESSVHNASDNDVLAAEMSGYALLRATDTHAHVVGLIRSGLVRDRLDTSERLAITQLGGAYRQELAAVAAHLMPTAEARYRELVDSPEWRLVDAARNGLADNGILTVPYTEWLAAEQSVGVRLTGLLRDQFQRTVAMSQDLAGRAFTRSLAAGAAVLAVTLAAATAALLLANRLVRRLRSLRSASLDLARQGLPAAIERIHRGEQVVMEQDVVVDRGTDEIGQVADAFAIAQRTAVDAAVAEARTREGFNKVFLDIAFRSQALVRRQLDVLDIAESKQLDPEHLELLFQLDHLATRARRNAENLLILGGRAPGRRWRDPVDLEEIVRSAASETEGFARVSTVRLPAVGILGPTVADLIHLLAELIDNAASFSPPEAAISVHGTMVGRGVVVEIVDQGLGIGFDERERINRLLREPPEFHEMALAGQRQLGMFVVGRLSRRHAVTVSLQESAYGGVTAIVLIPWSAVDRTSAQVARDTRTAAALVPAADSPPALDGQAAARTPVDPTENRRPPLPRRQRPRTLAPPDDEIAADTSPGHPRSPATARTSLAALQQGTRRARRLRHPHP
ncbi:histidine kinase/DNA gyrase B/HSP90-like ATPase [Nocardia mexicana]|uniref:histidine kinase n=2 Tax=Nocardia mexicana TaxID=279262 RepID=A0A370HFG3_9NOCA|nr:histidine kinase/DNA gyrase B/HSP90-like ATPase [Nocardia mexicana]